MIGASVEHVPSLHMNKEFRYPWLIIFGLSLPMQTLDMGA